MRSRLTEVGIGRLRPPETGRLEIFDDAVPALAVRVTANGAKSFVVRCRIKGHASPIRLTLGDATAMKVADARREASDVLQACRAGQDPREGRRQHAVETERAMALEWSSVANSFVEKHAKRNRTWGQTDALFRNHVTPRWRGRALGEITRADVVSLLDDIEAKVSVYQANRALAAVRKLFNWAVLRGLIPASPIVAGMAREGEEARARFLTFDEIGIVWRAAERLGEPFGPLFQLLLVTGQRRNEVAAARWDALDLERERVWTLTAEETKAGREHLVPLTELAMGIIRRLGRLNDPRAERPVYAFTTNGAAPVSGFSKAKMRLDAEIAKATGPLPAWRVHDLRRTVATHMEDALGIPPHIVGSVLNHTPAGYKGVTAIYTRGDLIFERRRALTAWSRLLKLIIEGGSTWEHVAKILRPETEADAVRTMELRRLIQGDEGLWDIYLKTLANQQEANVVRLAS